MRKPKNKKIANYEELFLYIMNLYSWKCQIAANKHEIKTASELHHALHNTKANRIKYPLFIDSVFNLIPVEHGNHLNNGSFGKISYLNAEKIENHLQYNKQVLEIGYFNNAIEMLEYMNKILLKDV